MAVSDAIYGHCKRYVSRERLQGRRVKQGCRDYIVVNLAGNCSGDACQNSRAEVLWAGTEITSNHRGRRDKSSGRVRGWILAGYGVLIAKEEEQFVLDYRTADGTAKLVPLESIALRRKEIAGVHVPVAQELERIAMEGVTA